MKVLFVSDFFLSDGVLGGAEMVDAEVINHLKLRDFDVEQVHSSSLTIDRLSGEVDTPIIISNFIQMPQEVRWQLVQNHNYAIIEHDHKYIKSRNPLEYENLQAPYHEITNEPLYKSASVVFCQTQMHKSILDKNIMVDNVVSFGGSLWSDEHLDLIESCISSDKEDTYAIMNSQNPIKNTSTAVAYCVRNGMDYSLIEGQSYEDFIVELSKHRGLVFFPTTYESCCRVVVEARMLGLEVISNDTIGALSEEWIEKSGLELINIMRAKKSEVIDQVVGCFLKKDATIESPRRSGVCIVTSVYNGDEYIENFLQEITKQTYFSHCELIMVNCNSPGNEEGVIQRYAEAHSNIKYIKLEEDPGVYGAWNIAIKHTEMEYITNANLDDCRHHAQIEQLVRVADHNHDCDLFYAPCFVTHNKNETFENNSSGNAVYPVQAFSKKNMIKCLPGPMPLWRRALHTKFGFFNEDYKSAGDWEMWLRATDGDSKFKMLPSILGLYYSNPLGLSTSTDNKKSKVAEERKVFMEYRHLFGNSLPAEIEEYFNG